jgi:hypothetical protein
MTTGTGLFVSGVQNLAASSMFNITPKSAEENQPPPRVSLFDSLSSPQQNSVGDRERENDGETFHSLRGSTPPTSGFKLKAGAGGGSGAPSIASPTVHTER